MEHKEHLTVPWWGWLLTVVAAAIFVTPFAFAAPAALRWVASAVPPAVGVGL